jgi:hypothetical protein
LGARFHLILENFHCSDAFFRIVLAVASATTVGCPQFTNFFEDFRVRWSATRGINFVMKHRHRTLSLHRVPCYFRRRSQSPGHSKPRSLRSPHRSRSHQNRYGCRRSRQVVLRVTHLSCAHPVLARTEAPSGIAFTARSLGSTPQHVEGVNPPRAPPTLPAAGPPDESRTRDMALGNGSGVCRPSFLC